MESILELKSVVDGAILEDAVVFLKEFKKLPKKDGKSFFITGEFTQKETRLAFKVWDATIISYMEGAGLINRPVIISGTVSTYNNNLDLKLTGITSADQNKYPNSMFLKSADVETLYTDFVNMINTQVSEKGIRVLMGIFQGENIMERFKAEFAGSKMHDSQIGGLLNHTVKMMRIGCLVYDNEPRMRELEDYKDLLLMGIVFHDMGKVYEMYDGVYQPNSFVTHRTLGVEIVVKYKAAIIELYDAEFYYELLAVIQGHHGEYGDKPTTITAYIVHLIDMVDSQVTSIFDMIESGRTVQMAGGIGVRHKDSVLFV